MLLPDVTTIADEVDSQLTQANGWPHESRADASNSVVTLPPSSEAKTMKTKTWTVITNTGKQADLESGLEKREVRKPTHISARDFVHWLAPESHIDDDSLRSLFKL